MSDTIDLDAKSDRDLLVMAVMQGNESCRHLEKLNGTMEKHEKRILANQIAIAEHSENTDGWSKKKILSAGGGVFLLGSFVAGVFQFVFDKVL